MKLAFYFGLSGKRNFGDWWLYEIIKNDLSELDLIPFTRVVKRHGVRQLVYRAWKRRLLPSAKIAILGGGTVLVPSGINGFAAMELMRGKRYSYGSGAMSVEECERGALVSESLRQRLLRLYEEMDRVTVRGPISQRSVQHLGVQREVTIVGDPMLALLRENPAVEPWDGKTVLLNVADLHGSQKFHGIPAGHDQESFFGALIEQCQARDCQIRIFYCAPEDRALSLKMARLHHIESVTEAVSPAEMDELFVPGAGVIATRLHAMIYSIISAMPTAGLLYQDKHLDFLHSIGWNGVPAPLQSLQAARVADYCEQMWQEQLTQWPVLTANMRSLNAARAQLAREISCAS